MITKYEDSNQPSYYPLRSREDQARERPNVWYHNRLETEIFSEQKLIYEIFLEQTTEIFLNQVERRNVGGLVGRRRKCLTDQLTQTLDLKPTSPILSA